MSKRSPSHRAPTATRTYNRQEFRTIIWLHVTVVSAVVMLAAWLLSGSIGDRRFYCSMIGSSAAIILSVCLVLSFPTLVRMMREQLEGPGAARPAVAALVMILLFALVAVFLSYKGSTSVVHLIGDARRDIGHSPPPSASAFGRTSTGATVRSRITPTNSPSSSRTDPRITSTYRPGHQGSLDAKIAPITPSTSCVLSDRRQQPLSLTSTRAAGSLRPSARREPNAPRQFSESRRN